MTSPFGAAGINLDRLAYAQVGPTDTSIYTAPGISAARTSISGIWVANPSPSDLTIRLAMTPQNQANDGTFYLFGATTVPANSGMFIDTPLVLRGGDSLLAFSDSLPTPLGLAIGSSATGGTLAAATYYYKITATNAGGETIGSGEVSTTVSGATSSVNLTWNRSLGATGYNIYRATAAGAEVLISAVSGGGSLSYTDTGAAAGTATPPGSGTAAGCRFAIIGAEIAA